jgi:hypothetical protein
MSKTFRCLVAATAATAALPLIPLAAASASTAVPTSTTASWSGYYLNRPGLTTYLGHRYQPRLDAAHASKRCQDDRAKAREELSHE